MTDSFVPLEPVMEVCKNKFTRDCFESCIKGFYINNKDEEVPISEMIQNCLNNTKSYPPDYQFELPPLTTPEKGEIEIRFETSLHGAYRMSVEEHKSHICVLNFANAFIPGGGALGKSNAQEESLCRSSALYYSEIQKEDFYRFHSANCDGRASNYMIFSPDCPTWKSDNYEILDRPIEVSYITAASANNRDLEFDREELRQIHDDRIKMILHCAICNGVKNFILGAFGCGAFRNDPTDIANSFKHWLVDEHLKDYFESVCFSIIERLDRKKDQSLKNIDVFANVFGLPVLKTMIRIHVEFDDALKDKLDLPKEKYELDIPYGTKTGTLPFLIEEDLIQKNVDDSGLKIPRYEFLYNDTVLNREVVFLINGEDVKDVGVEIFLQNDDYVEFDFDGKKGGSFHERRYNYGRGRSRGRGYQHQKGSYYYGRRDYNRRDRDHK